MKALRLFGTLVICALLMVLAGAAQTLARTADLPAPAVNAARTAAPQAPPLIIDHATTDIKAVPQAWIEEAKRALHIYYGHTSHGSQLTTGMQGLIGFANGGGLGLALPPDIFDGLDVREDSPDAGYYPEWVDRTRAYLGTPVSATGRGAAHPEINVVTWSWCGQVSGISEQDLITNYLQPMNQLEIDYPGVKFVYMTGHSDGSGGTGNLHMRNQQIRQYAVQNNKILYDFYHIELYDPDGNYYGDKDVNDNCDYDSDGNGTLDKNWALDWQNSHIENQDWYSCSCAHSQSLNCNQKAYAAWWLWARLAGWPGPQGTPLSISKGVALTHDPAWPGDAITYTLVVRNSTVTDTTDVRITDTLPSGVVGVDLDITRMVTGNSAITLTIPAAVASDVPSGAFITNTAFFTHASGGDYARASFHVTTLLPDFSTSTKRAHASSVQAGDLVTFTLVFTNTGLANATVRYTDTLPAQVDWQSGALSGTIPINAGTSASRVIVARVRHDLLDGATFSNTAAVNDGVHAVFNLASPNVTVLAPDLTHSIRAVNKSHFEPGERITYTLTLFNSGGASATVRYTATLPSEVISPSGSLSGTMPVGVGTVILPAVVAGQVRDGLAAGITFQAHVDIDDGYHPVYTLDFPLAAIHAFYTYLPLVIRNVEPPTS